jgi:hypothetical protein
MTGNRGQKTEDRSRVEAAPTVSQFLNSLIRNFDLSLPTADLRMLM